MILFLELIGLFMGNVKRQIKRELKELGTTTKVLRLRYSMNIEVFAKVEGEWFIAKSIRSIVPIPLAVSKASNALKMYSQTTFNEQICSLITKFSLRIP